MPRRDAVDVAGFDLGLQLADIGENGASFHDIPAHRGGVVQRLIFDCVGVTSRQSGKSGECSDSIVDIAVIEEGKHVIDVVYDLLVAVIC